MSFLIDTNVLSELRKGSRADGGVISWWRAIDSDEIWLSVLVLGEIRKGIEAVRRRDPVQAERLEDWSIDLRLRFAEKILPIDERVSDIWGHFAAIRPVSVVDSLLAATAAAHGLILVTRNERDIGDLGVPYLNPFDA